MTCNIGSVTNIILYMNGLNINNVTVFLLEEFRLRYYTEYVVCSKFLGFQVPRENKYIIYVIMKFKTALALKFKVQIFLSMRHFGEY